MAGDKVRGAKVSPIYRFQGREISVGTTAKRLGEVQAEKHYILILGKIDNTDVVYIGNEEKQIIPILAGGYVLLYSDLYDIFAKAQSGTQTIYIISQKDAPLLYGIGRIFQSIGDPNQRVIGYDGELKWAISSAGIDGRENTANRLLVESYPSLFNEISWDRKRNNVELTILASATRTSTTNSADQVNYNHRGMILYLDITARTVGVSPLINLKIQVKDPTSGKYTNIYESGNFDPTTVLRKWLIYPAVSDAGAKFHGYNDVPLPRKWRISVEFVQDVTDLTFSVGAHMLM